LATNTRGALKAFIESIPGTNLTLVASDVEPEGAVEPYVVILGPIAYAPDKLEGGGAAFTPLDGGGLVRTGETQTVSEQYQVDLWQKWKAPDNSLLESSTLPDLLIAALHGARLPAGPKVVYACLVRGAPRFHERDANLVHHPITVEVRRQL
jgi:hypothetical protein